jgi:hypothetical protein
MGGSRNAANAEKSTHPTVFPRNTSPHSRKSCPTDARPVSTGSIADVVCSVKSAERPTMTKMNPTA